MTRSPTLELSDIVKHFGAIKAVDGVSMSIMPGECVGLVGDNGAGKSTLVKVISGFHSPTSGDVRVDGKQVTFHSPSDSRASKIETVYQNLALVDQLDAAANFFLGREIFSNWGNAIGYLSKARMREKAAAELKRIGVSIPSMEIPVSQMSGGQRQGIAMARSVFWGSKCLILDEPTAALGVKETSGIVSQIEKVIKSGVSVLFVAHDIDLIKEICNRIVVLRHGKVWSELKAADISTEDIVHHITGTKKN